MCHFLCKTGENDRASSGAAAVDKALLSSLVGREKNKAECHDPRRKQPLPTSSWVILERLKKALKVLLPYSRRMINVTSSRHG